MTDNQLERRAYALDACKVETRTKGKQPKIIGHAAVFDVLSENLGGFREIIKPGAFTKALQEDDIRALFNHNPGFILGRKASGTLALREDDKGLAIEIIPPDTHTANDVLKSIERGDISQMSFGFRVRAGGESWSEDENGETIRTLTDLKLFDVSPVTFPAYPKTGVAVRSLTQHQTSQGKIQHNLRTYFFAAKGVGIKRITAKFARYAAKPEKQGQPPNQNAWQIGYQAGKTDKLPEPPPGLEDEHAFINGFCAGQADRQTMAKPRAKRTYWSLL
jgi:HK97 family phage prohead protease